VVLRGAQRKPNKIGAVFQRTAVDKAPFLRRVLTVP
jgi:hypothetical protein